MIWRFSFRAARISSLVCCFVFTIGTQRAPATTTGDIGGTVFAIDSDGSRSVIAGARVRFVTSESLLETSTDQAGRFTFTAVAPASYQIEVNTNGLAGSAPATVVSGTALDVPVELKPKAIRQSVTVSANENPAISPDSSSEGLINRSVVLDAPNKYDQFDALLPLV